MTTHLIHRPGPLNILLLVIFILLPANTPASATAAPVEAQCLKVEGTRLRPNPNDRTLYRMQLAEIEVYVYASMGQQNSTFNGAPGAGVTASSSFEGLGWSTAKVNDGEWNTVVGTSWGWSSDRDTALDHTEWIQLNFGGRLSIYRVELFPRNDPGNIGQGFPIDFTIQATTDTTCSSGWVTVVSRKDFPQPGDAGQSFNFASPLQNP